MEDKSFKDLIAGVDSPLANTEDEMGNTVPIENKEQTNAQSPSDTPVCIIDETNTTFTIDDGGSKPAEIPEQTQPTANKPPKKKKVKTKGGKLNKLQITLICIVSVVALWVAMFTVDHTLAANGLSPIFCVSAAKYEDGSESFIGLGYKVHFKFDEYNNLTQKCFPFWEDGPNDIKTEK